MLSSLLRPTPISLSAMNKFCHWVGTSSFSNEERTHTTLSSQPKGREVRNAVDAIQTILIGGYDVVFIPLAQEFVISEQRDKFDNMIAELYFGRCRSDL